MASQTLFVIGGVIVAGGVVYVLKKALPGLGLVTAANEVQEGLDSLSGVTDDVAATAQALQGLTTGVGNAIGSVGEGLGSSLAGIDDNAGDRQQGRRDRKTKRQDSLYSTFDEWGDQNAVKKYIRELEDALRKYNRQIDSVTKDLANAKQDLAKWSSKNNNGVLDKREAGKVAKYETKVKSLELQLKELQSTKRQIENELSNARQALINV